MAGHRFGRLLVIEQAEDKPGSGQNGAFWLVKCDCGSPAFVTHGSHLRRGASRSCGCFNKEMSRATCLARATHGEKRVDVQSKEYLVWTGIIDRCCRESSRAFKNYGGRGIRVCDEWRASYVAFLRDMGRKPTPGHTIDRINNDGNYEPGNCRWATRKEQMQNTRINVFLEHEGRRQTVAQWAEELGINYHTLYNRVQLGWTTERALTPDAAPTIHRVLYEHNGERLWIGDWSNRTGLPFWTIKGRLRQGWTMDAALTTPHISTRTLTMFRGEVLSIHQIAERTGAEYALLRSRIQNGWEVERALSEPRNPRRGGLNRKNRA